MPKRPGYPSTFRPPPSYQKPIPYLKIDIQLLQSQVDELVQALLKKYRESPDAETKKLLIIYLGSEFFIAQLGEGMNDEPTT